MDYKQFQRAITDRLGSQFGLSVLISFVFINWELLFKMADLGLSIDNKIDMIKLWDFRLGWFVVDIFIIILIFQLGNLIAKTAGTYINQVLWGKILAAIGNKTQYVDRDIHEMVLKDRDDFKDMRDNYSEEISKLKGEVDKQRVHKDGAEEQLQRQKDKVAQKQTLIEDHTRTISAYQNGVHSLLEGIHSINLSQYREKPQSYFLQAAGHFHDADEKATGFSRRINNSFLSKA